MKRFDFDIKFVKLAVSFAIILLFIWLSVYLFDLSQLLSMTKKLLNRPVLVLLILLLYCLSFCLKAWAWKLYLHSRPRFFSCLLGIIYSLFINHISPIKAGDIIRAAILTSRDPEISGEESVHSVIVLRILDVISLLTFTLLGLVLMNMKYSIPLWLFSVTTISGGLLLILIRKRYTMFFEKHFRLLKLAFSGVNGLFILCLTALSWVLEASVLFGTVTAVNKDLSFVYAVWVNSLTVAGQVFQITPGGLANYETIMTFSLGMIGFSMKEGYTIAIMTHGVKFLFSYLAGAIAIYAYPISYKRIRNWIKRKRSEAA